MRGLYCLCFTFLVKHCFSYAIFPDVLETAIQNLRSKREASCGGDIDVSEFPATIQLPTEIYNGTEFYRVNEDCTWRVNALESQIMILRSEYFSLEESHNCIWDYLEIIEAFERGPPVRCCGWDPKTYITASSEIILHFKSDVSYEDRGFKFTVETRPKYDADDSKCDSSIIGGEDSRIMNSAAEGKGCVYRIESIDDRVIELNLKMLYFGSATCDEECIVVYEGLTTQGEPLETICSDAIQGIRPYHVKTLFVEYRNPLKQEGERFMIEYSFVEDIFTPPPVPPTVPSPVGGNNDCSGMYRDFETEGDGYLIYTAPEYQNNRECINVVRNTLLRGHVVQIEFMYFETEDSDDCMFDSFKIMSGERADSTPLGGPYCGDSLHGRTFVSIGNSLRFEFQTDVSFALRGMKAKISFVPSHDCTCERNQICIRQDYEKKCIRGQECTANTCQNGGTCIRTGSSQTCYCPAGFSGEDCTESDGEIAYHLHFVVAPLDRTLKRDESHTEECFVEAPPGEEVQYDWTFNGILIESYNRRTGFGSHPGGLLQIDKFTDELEGQYSCVASTSSGIAEHTFEYRIVDNCDVRIYPGPQSESKKINENALLICHVDSRAKEVRWKKDGVYIDYDSNSRIRKMVNNYLYITNIGLSDAGVYRCEAEDEQGCFSYKEGKLTVVNVKPRHQYCGKALPDEVHLAHSRISKGYDAKRNANPWHVTLRSTGGASRHMAFCGGSLISQKFVLTAAHCVLEFEEKLGAPFTKDNVVILLGTTDCLGIGGDETVRTIKRYIKYPAYSKTTPYDNDIALLELDSLVEYTDSIRPICVELAEYNDRVFLENSDSLSPVPGKVTGCGMKSKVHGGLARTLQELHIPYVKREECLESLDTKDHLLTDTMFCAGSKIARTGDTCQGDSGGGLVMATADRWVLTGIVSWGMGCDVDRFYGVYTDVGKFYDWIEENTHFSEEEVPDFTLF